MRRSAPLRSLPRLLLPFLALLAAAALAGCRTVGYRPLAVDLEAHETDWRTRAPDPDALEAQAPRLAGLCAGAPGPFDLADGLSLPEASQVALVFNPEVRQARLEARVPLVSAQQAGRWEDPAFEVDLLRILESVSHPWLLGSGLRLTVPLSGRLGAERARAFAEADVATLRAAALEWETISALRGAWAAWTRASRRRDVIDGWLEELDGILRLAEAQREADELGRPQLRVLQLERARLAAQRLATEGEIEEQRLRILGLMGLAPDAPVSLVPTLALGPPPPPEAERRERLRQGNADLAVARAELETADRTLRLELRKQYPDLELGPSFEAEEGAARLGGGVGLPLPLWNRNRRGIAEAYAAREAALGALESRHEVLLGELAVATSSSERSARQLEALETTLAPLAEEQLDELRRLADLGDLDVLVLLDALTRKHETRLDVLDARVAMAVARSELCRLFGPPWTRLAPAPCAPPAETTR